MSRDLMMKTGWVRGVYEAQYDGQCRK